MAHGSISKKRAPASKHSREARRATSPSINTDKSLKEARAPAESIDHRPSILSIHQGAGVSKKQARGRNLSTRAKKRAEKGQDKAIAIIERTEIKVQKSKGSSKNIQTRAKNWDDINKAIPQSANPFAGLDDGEGQSSDLDDEMDELNQANTAVVQGRAAKVPLLPLVMDDDDEVL